MTHDRITLTPAQRLIVALDVPHVSAAVKMVHTLMPVVDTFKIGYWLLFEPGLFPLVRELRMRNKRLFIDAKLNDIPETVRHGVISAIHCGADFITVHSDEQMLHAAMDGKGNSSIQVMAVTALTSLPAAASRDRFRAGIVNACIAGCDGLIMAPSDLNDDMGVRETVGKMLIATPGIRLGGVSTNDHGRTGTPDRAIRDGADYLIIGRPIIHADNPLAAAEQFIEHISNAQSAVGQAPSPEVVAQTPVVPASGDPPTVS